MGGLRTRLKDFREAVSLCNYSIIVILETWLTPNFSHEEVYFQSYHVYRKDRDADLCNKKRGGGVLIAVSEEFASRLISVPTNEVEELYIEIKCAKQTFIIGGVYIPPNSTVEQYNKHCETVLGIMESFPSATLTIFGDYNLPDTVWHNEVHGVSVSCQDNSPALLIAEAFSFLGMFQVNTIPNNRQVYLDLVFSHQHNMNILPACDTLLPNSVHHIAHYLEIPINHKVNSLDYDIFYFDFRNGNFQAINDHLYSIDWDNLFGECNLNQAVEYFYSAIYHCLETYVPLKRIKNSNFPSWFSLELKNLIIMKKIAHKNYMLSRDPDDYAEFSRHRNLCKIKHNFCYQAFISRTEEDLLVNPKRFWKYVNEKRKMNSLPNTMFYGPERGENGEEIVGLFASHFSSVYDKSDCPIPIFPSTESKDISISKFSISEVFNEINGLPNKLSSGPDQIPNFFLKNCLYSITKPLRMIFNMSIDLGQFPDIWKLSYVIPIFKSGDPENVGNYRGVCNQSSMAKLFDNLVYDQLSWSCKGLINFNQFGFCKHKSTTTNLVQYEVDLLEVLERGGQVDSIYTDFSKAFDRVNFGLLLAKLLSIGFAPHSLKWLESFLRGRTQSVKINNFISTEFKVSSGVPQGSHCAPLLFNLFVNDLCSRLEHCKVSQFADDLKFYKQVKCHRDAEDLQKDLNVLWEWSQVNNLHLNIDKCCYISFFKGAKKHHSIYHINNENLKYVNEVKDLGVWFTENLSFHDHITKISLKGTRILGFILRNCSEFSISTINSLYCSLVRSNLEYSTIVWSPQYQLHSDRIERVQNKYLRFAAFKCGVRMEDYHRAAMLGKLNLQTLQERRMVYDVSFVFKLITGQIDAPNLLALIKLNVPKYNLRNVELFNITFHRTNFGSHTPLERGLRILNSLSNNVDVFRCTLSGLKSRAIMLNNSF